MPLGFQRLNERIKRPNELINFIRPLKGASESTSQDYLERIAAIVYPVMKANHIAVMALEEYPPNPEFWGRNFNAGEVIQLVLKSRNGSWLPFRHVQMVMIHELAHCKEMNHSRFFWRVRNSYSDELKGLWSKGYTGEGLWGAGRGLGDGSFLTIDMPDTAIFPESLCGGVYRNKRKRKRGEKAYKSQLSYAERKQRRILKKFGAGGISLGADEDERQRLEQGKKVKGKPRVAGSNRARELRAAAALARFEKAKVEVEEPKQKVKEESSGSEFDYSWSESERDNKHTILQSEGKELVKVCEDENADDPNVKQEMEDMMTSLETIPSLSVSKKSNKSASNSIAKSHSPLVDKGSKSSQPNVGSYKNATTKTKDIPSSTKAGGAAQNQKSQTAQPREHLSASSESTLSCPVCSFNNVSETSLCMACSNVLDSSNTWNHWRCSSEVCKDSLYINSGDYALCQVCGARNPEGATKSLGNVEHDVEEL